MEFDLQPSLRGDLIELRPLTPDDFDALYEAAKDPEIWEQHPESDRYKPEVFRKYFDGAIESGGAFAIVERSSGRIIGSSRYCKLKPAESEVEIGWTFLEREFWGGAYNKELKSLMLDHALRFVDRVVFVVGASNIRSQRALEKIGARFWKRAPRPGREDATETDVLYIITRSSRRSFHRHAAKLDREDDAPVSQPAKPRGTAIPAGFALAAILLHLTCLTQYGWFRDELYYMASTRHLAWGYVDHPPLSIALLTLVRLVFGDSLAAIRIVAAILGAATVFLTGRLARAAGGGAFAQTLACLSALLAPVYLAIGHFYSMNAIEMVLWPLASLLLLRALRTGRVVDWALLGALLGVGLLNKISASWLGIGIAAGLLLTPHRRALRTPGPWIAAVVAALCFLPHVLWQSANGFPTLEFMRNATAHKMVVVSPQSFLREQVLVMGPGNAVVWVAGLWFALFSRSGKPWRLFGWIWLAVATILLVGGKSRASYLTPAYPAILAAGGVAWERLLSDRARWARAPIVLLISALGIAAMPFALPILPVDPFLRYQAALHMTPKTEERQSVGPLSQQYADMFGWDELARKVAEVWKSLPPEERLKARVFGQNYGEAGAVDVLDGRLGLPPAISGHNSYWMWGPQGWDGSVLIIIGGDPEDNAAWFRSVNVVSMVDSPLAMPYERGIPISIGRGLKIPVAEAWPKLKHFI